MVKIEAHLDSSLSYSVKHNNLTLQKSATFRLSHVRYTQIMHTLNVYTKQTLTSYHSSSSHPQLRSVHRLIWPEFILSVKTACMCIYYIQLKNNKKTIISKF